MREPEERARPRSPTLLRFDGLGQIWDVALALDVFTRETDVRIVAARICLRRSAPPSYARRRVTVAAGIAAYHTVARLAQWYCSLSTRLPAADGKTTLGLDLLSAPRIHIRAADLG